MVEKLTDMEAAKDLHIAMAIAKGIPADQAHAACDRLVAAVMGVRQPQQIYFNGFPVGTPLLINCN